MKKWIIMALIIAPFAYAYHYKPLLNVHQQKIYQQAAGTETVAAAIYDLPAWDGLEFVDWNFVTATRDKNKQSLVSFGIVSYIKVVDSDWAPKAFGLKPREVDGGTK
jgi:hypothetical protein